MNLFNALRPTRATCRSSQSALPWNKEGVAARPSPPERSCRFKQAIVRIVTGLRIGTAAFAALLALTFAPAAAAYTPAAPTGLTATAGEGEVVLSWSKSWIDNGAGEDADNDWWLDGYQVRYRKGASFPNGGGWRNISGSTFRTTTHTVTGLENGADYVFQIRRAYDVFPPWGWWYSRQYGPSSGVAAATPRGPVLAFDGAATIADQSYVQGAAIAALVLPAATGGNGALSYALTPTLPAGLSLDMATRTVSGTPTALQAATSYSWTVNDTDGDSASLNFSIEVVAPSQQLTFGDASVPDVVWLVYYVEWDMQLPAATGGAGAVSYALSPALPEGLAFTASDRRIKGWGSARGVSDFKTYTLTATDAVGQQASLTFKFRLGYIRPAMPANFAAQAGNGQVTLDWDDPDDPNVDHYELRYRKGGGFSGDGGWTKIAGSSGTTTSHVVTGLENGAQYAFQIRSADALPGHEVNESQPSVTVTATPNAVPGAPTGLTAVGGNGRLALAWTLPTNTTDIEKQQVRWKVTSALPFTAGDAWTDLAGDATSHQVTGLANDIAVSVELRAVNGLGAGPAATVAGTPQDLTPSFGNASVADLDWDFRRYSSFLPEWDEQLPAATGGVGAVTYALTPALPDGFAFTASDRRIKGWGTARSADGSSGTIRPFKTYTLTATDEAGQQASLTFKLRFQYIAPAIPTNLAAQAGDGQVTLSWDDPDDPWMTDYQLRYRKGTSLSGRGGWATIAGSSGATTSHVVTGLDNGAGYAFQIRALRRHAGGFTNSSASETATATPNAVPGAPTGLTAVGGNGRLALAWTLPTNTTDIEKQQLRWKITSALPFTASDAWTDLAGDATSHQVTGLANDIAVSVELRAVNGLGTGPAATVAGTPYPKPGAPAGLGAFLGDGEVHLRWTDPNNPYITGYEYDHSPGDIGWTLIGDSNASTTTATVTGLTNGTTYTIRLRAVTADHEGDVSFITATLEETPSTPTIDSVVAGDGTVTWTVSAQSYETITSWQARLKVKGAATYPIWSNVDVTGSGASRTIQIGNLTNGTTYVGQVRAMNGVVVGPASNEAEVTPDLPPSRPQGFNLVPGDAKVNLAWNDQSSESRIDNWQYQQKVGTAGWGEWTEIGDSHSATTSHAQAGLTNGTTYGYRIRARTIGGVVGAAAGPLTATPNAVPGAPTGLAAVGGNGGLALSWALPTNTSDIGKLQLRWKASSALPFTASDAWTDLAGDATGYRLTGLTNETAYSIELRAANGLGAGPVATVSGTPQDLTPSFGDATVADRSFTKDATIATFVLPEASGGDGTLSYALTPTLPAGLSLDMATRTVSGTPTALQAATSYSWTATDEDGDAASLSFTIEVVAPSQQLTFGDASVPDLDWTFAGLWNYQLPAATGGAGAVSYALTPALPEGLAFTASDRRVKGRGSADETSWTYTTYTLTATDEAGQQATLTFELRIKYLEPDKPANFVAQAGDEQVTLSWDDPDDPHMTDYELRYRKGENFSDDSGWTKIAGSSGATTSHVVTGLENGSQYVFQIRAVYTFRDYTNESYASDAVTVTLPTVPGAPTGLTAVGGNGRLALAWTLPTNTTDIEKQQVRWKVTSALPFTASDAWTDLAGDATSHQVTGLSNGIAVSVELRAMNRKGTGPATTVSGTPQDLTPSFGTETIANRGVVQNAAIAPFALPEASGGDGTLSYALTPTLPAGLSLDMATRTVSGTPTALQAATSYSWTATDEDGDAASLSFTIEVVAPSQQLTFGDASVPDLDWTFAGLWNYQLPAATGGAGAVSYALTPALPEGLAFTASDRRVKGRGSADETSWTYTTYTLTATDEAGQQASLTFELRVKYLEPDKPGNFVAQAGDEQVTLSWDDPDDPHMTDYELRYRKGENFSDDSGWTKIAGSSGATTSHVVTGLENGSQYVFQIRAVYTFRDYTNESYASDAVTVTLPTVPGAPTGLTAVGGNGRLALAWTLPTNTTDIEKQQVRWKVTSALPFTASDAWTDLAGDATSHQVTGLSNDISVSVELRAMNRKGTGPAATVSGTPQDLTPSFGTETIANRGVVQNAAIAPFALPEASGGDGTLSYALAPTLPAGLSLDMATRTVSGTPTALQAATSYSWTVTDADGDSASLNFTMQVLTPAQLLTFGDASVPKLDWRFTGLWNYQLPAATGGAGTVSYALTPALPEGLAFTASDRRVKGRGTARSADAGLVREYTTYTLTATDATGQQASLTFELRLSYYVPDKPANVVAQSGDGQVTLSWDDPDDPHMTDYELRYSKGTSIGGHGGWTKIAGSSGATTSHVVTGLENGSQYVFQIRAIYTRSGPVSYTNGSVPSDAVTATPNAVPGAPTGLTAVGGNGRLALAWTLPTNTTDIEKQQVRWKVTSALPFTASDAWTDLAGDATSHQVTGLANGIAVSVELRAVNGLGAGPAATVAGTPQDLTPSFGAATIADWNVAQNAAIAAFALPEASGGDGTLSYALTPDLPAGLTLDAATRTVSGTPTALQAATSYSWTATDADGDSASLSFTMQVLTPAHLLTFGDASVRDLDWLVYWVEWDMQLPAATGGLGAVSYALTPTLPEGLAFTASDRRIKGWGSARGVSDFKTYTLTATDAVGQEASLTFKFKLGYIRPAIPANFTAQAGNGQVTLDWDDPDDPNVDYYELRYRKGGGFSGDGGWTKIAGSSGATTSHVVTGLENGAQYAFQIRSAHVKPGAYINESQPSVTVTAVPNAVPGAPTGLTAVGGNGGLALAWTLPTSTTAIEKQQLRWKVTSALPFTASDAWTDIAGDATSHQVTGLSNGIAVSVELRAVNGLGAGPAAMVSGTPQDPTPSFGAATIADRNVVQNAAIAAFALPEASGGDGTLSYALTPDLPAGLVLDTATRTVSGTPTALQAAASYSWTATDADGDVASLPFTIRVVATGELPSFGSEAIPDLNWYVGHPVRHSLTLPAATGGTGALTYSLAPALPAGVTFDGATRELAGVPWNGPQNITYTYTAEDEDGDRASLTFNMVNWVFNGSEFEPANLAVEASNGQVTLTWNAPPYSGLQYYEMRFTDGAGFGDDDAWTRIPGSDTTSRVVTGLTNGTAYRFELRAIITFGASRSIAITATPQDRVPSFGTATIADRSLAQNVAIAAFVLPEASGGDGTLSYALTPDLPAGLSLDMATRTVSGTPTALQAATSYSWTATDADGDSASLSFTMPVVTPAQLLTFGDASVPDLDWLVYWVEWDMQLPAATGGVGAVSYALSPALPEGLAFTASDRRIKGWGSARGVSDFKTYTLTATDAVGQQALLTFKFKLGYIRPAIPANFTAQAGNGQVTLDWDDPDDPNVDYYELRYRKGGGFSGDGGWTKIAGSSGATTSHVVTGLENGAQYAFQIRSAHVKPGAYINESQPSVTVTAVPNAVPGAPTGLTAVGGNGGLALAWTLPTSTTAIEKQQLRWKVTSALPFTASDAWTDIAGDATSHQVTGLSNGIAVSVELRAVNGLGAGPAATVAGTPQNLTPSFGTATIADRSLAQNVAIAAFVLPEASGGDGTLSYALTPDLPAGLSLDMATRTVSGTPTVALAVTTYSWTATDEDGDAASLSFTMEVAAGGGANAAARQAFGKSLAGYGGEHARRRAADHRPAVVVRAGCVQPDARRAAGRVRCGIRADGVRLARTRDGV